MEMRVERIIHPAGFGAFCTERFIGRGIQFNMMYDCGSKYLAQRQIVMDDLNHYYANVSHIDLLCISHFDEDHINIIRELIKSKRLILPGRTTILLPFLDTKYYQMLNNVVDSVILYVEIRSLIDENHINVIEVLPFNLDQRTQDRDLPPLILNPENPNAQQIASGLPIQPLKNYPIWKYIPFNVLDNGLYSQIINELKRGENPLSDEDLNLINKGDINVAQLKKLKSVCKRIGISDNSTSKANMNSMMLLSLPVENHPYYYVQGSIRQCNCAHVQFSGDCSCCCCDKDKCLRRLHWMDMSCLYTGDVSFKAQVSKDIVKKYKSDYFFSGIGLLQIPHHGAFSCYDSDLVKEIDCDFAFVNTDLERQVPQDADFYAQMVVDFKHWHRCLFMVRRDNDTMFKQVAYFNI